MPSAVRSAKLASHGTMATFRLHLAASSAARGATVATSTVGTVAHRCGAAASTHVPHLAASFRAGAPRTLATAAGTLQGRCTPHSGQRSGATRGPWRLGTAQVPRGPVCATASPSWQHGPAVARTAQRRCMATQGWQPVRLARAMAWTRARGRCGRVVLLHCARCMAAHLSLPLTVRGRGSHLRLACPCACAQSPFVGKLLKGALKVFGYYG